MKKVIVALMLLAFALPAFAQESTVITSPVIANTTKTDEYKERQIDLNETEIKELIKLNTNNNWALFLGAGLAIGLAGLGAGVGMGSAIRGGLEGISRNPGVAGKIFTYLLVGVALIESIAIYGLVVSLILLFVK